MGTRAQIAAVGTRIKLYKHSDGYPEEVLPVVKPALERFLNQEAWDPERLNGYLIGGFVIAEELRRQRSLLLNPEPIRTWYERPSILGYGLSTAWAPDIEYAYILTPKGVEVYRVEGTPYGEELEGVIKVSKRIGNPKSGPLERVMRAYYDNAKWDDLLRILRE